MTDLIKELPSVPKATYDPGRQCMDGTRKEVIAAALKWASTPGEPRVYWLSGQAGRGKTAIATSIACALHDEKSLGGTFFFRRDDEERRQTDKVFSSIAYQMSTAYEPLHTQICAVLSKDKDVGKYSPWQQFKNLIHRPLQAAQGFLHQPVVILFDALDECGETDDDRRLFLLIIQKHLQLLPNTVKFIITSRPDPDLKAAFQGMDGLVDNFDLDRHAADLVSQDIMEFFKVKLVDVALSHGLGSDWPDKPSLEALVQQAGGLFQWAKVACDVIKDDDSDGPDAQLKFILEKTTSSAATPALPSPWAALDTLYFQVLRPAATAAGSRLPEFRDILATIVLARSPLSALSLGRLLGVTAKIVQQRLRKLHSVVDVPNISEGDLRIIHPSFADFLTNHSRCTDNDLYIHTTQHHGRLARMCLDRMQCDKGDTCELADARGITPDLVKELHCSSLSYLADATYPRSFWSAHVSLSTCEDAELVCLVWKFLSHNYLHAISFQQQSFLSQAMQRWAILRPTLTVVDWALVMFCLCTSCDTGTESS